MSDTGDVPASEDHLRGAVDRERVRRAVRELLTAIGEDPDREGLVRTPSRVAEMYGELFDEASEDPARFLTVTFAPNTMRWSWSATSRSRPCASTTWSRSSQGPRRLHPSKDGRITGLSKLARVVDAVAGRLQVQERMTTQIAEAIEAALAPRACWW